MGLFSTKKKHIVDVTVQRVVEDEQVLDPGEQSTIEAVFTGDDLMNAFQRHALYGAFRNFEKMYKYAASNDYTYGLPNARVLSSEDGVPLAIQAIEAEEALEVTIEYCLFKPFNNLHLAFEYITNNWGFERITNRLDGSAVAAPVDDVFIEKIVTVHQIDPGNEPEAGSLGTLGESSENGPSFDRPISFLDPDLLDLVVTQEVREGEFETESAEIHYYWEVEEAIPNSDNTQLVTYRGMYVLDLSSYDGDVELYQAKYTVPTGELDELSQPILATKYWTYNPETGMNTGLNEIFARDAQISAGTYFPFAIFRREAESRSDVALAATEEHQSTTKLLDYLGISFQDIGDEIEQNPDIGVIRSAVMLMGVPITTTNQIEIEYLYEYFKELEASLPETAKAAYSPLAHFSGDTTTDYAVEITDADYRMTMSFGGVSRRFRSGSIGTVGSFENTTITLTGPDIFTIGYEADAQSVTQTTARVIRKQITTQVYDEIILERPVMRWDVYRDKYVEGGDDDERFLVPLDYNVTKELALVKREQLYFRSLHFVFLSHVVEKTKWYQTGAFKALLVIVAIVVTIYTGWDAISAAYAAAGAGAAGVTAAAVVIAGMLVETFVIGAILQILFKQVVKVIGIEAAFILAVATLIAGGYKAIETGKIVINSTAKNLLTISANLSRAVGVVTQDLIADLQKEMQQFMELMDEKWQELEELREGLENPISIPSDYFIGQQPRILFGEAPGDFYNRTIHAGNVGVKSYDFIENFAEISLTLPRTSQTLQGV